MFSTFAYLLSLLQVIFCVWGLSVLNHTGWLASLRIKIPEMSASACLQQNTYNNGMPTLKGDTKVANYDKSESKNTPLQILAGVYSRAYSPFIATNLKNCFRNDK